MMEVELQRTNTSTELKRLGRSVHDRPSFRDQLTGDIESDLVLLREVEKHEARYEAIRLAPLLKQESLQLPKYRLAIANRPGLFVHHPLGYLLYHAGNIRDLTVCDFCCGPGEYAVYLALQGADVWGFDICEEAIQLASKLAQTYNVESHIRLSTASAYATGYADNMFDVVFAYGALHHLYLDLALHEIKRILKPGGRLIFFEPTADEPLMRFLKSKVFGTSAVLTQFEQPLTKGDIELIQTVFSRSRSARFRFLARFEKRIAMPDKVLMLYKIDQKLFHLVPFLTKYASSIAGIFIST